MSEFPGRTCPHCHQDASGATTFDGADVARPGSINVCISCAQLTRLEADGSLAVLSAEEESDLADHPTVLAAKGLVRRIRVGLAHPERN